MKLKMDELMDAAKARQAVCHFTRNIRKTTSAEHLFPLIATQGEMHKSKKAQRKNLVQAIC